MKKKLTMFLVALSLGITLLGSINTASAYCWRGYYGRIHCTGWNNWRVNYWGPRYYGPRAYGPRCRSWIGPYGYVHRRCYW